MRYLTVLYVHFTGRNLVHGLPQGHMRLRPSWMLHMLLHIQPSWLSQSPHKILHFDGHQHISKLGVWSTEPTVTFSLGYRSVIPFLGMGRAAVCVGGKSKICSSVQFHVFIYISDAHGQKVESRVVCPRMLNGSKFVLYTVVSPLQDRDGD